MLKNKLPPVLKPCPFCGGKANIAYNAKRKSVYGGEVKGTCVYCTNCGVDIFHRSTDMTIQSWNRRVNDE